MPNEAKNGGRFLGKCTTRKKCNLSLVGERHSAWLVEDWHKGCQVYGECYVVTEEQLTAIDELERINESDGYQRKIIEILDGRGKVRQVFAYLKTKKQLRAKRSISEVKEERLQEYTSMHATLYKKRAEST